VPEHRLHRTYLHSDRFLPSRFLRPVLRFTRVEAAGGVVMLVAAAAALVWANLPGGGRYEGFWQTPLDLTLGPLGLHLTLRTLVNDALMTVFFYVVGLEIKREMVHGELRDPKKAALPILAALGGMAVPALIYLAFNTGGEATRGWAIPVATDIAFSVGVLALLGSRIPVGARLFLLTLAVADDVGGITIIAVAYTRHLEVLWLLAALAVLATVWAAGRAQIRSMAFYIPLAFLAWLFLLQSGVHATLSGVALALLTPATPMYDGAQYRERARRILALDGAEAVERADDEDAITLSLVARESVSPLARLEEKIVPWSSFLVVPVFALANAGVRFADMDVAAAFTHPVTLGTALGLLVGKAVGITAAAWAAVRLGWGRLPDSTGWRHIVGLATVGGIGFTVALFITGLAFEHPVLTDQAKLGIFVGSLLAGIIGYLVLRGTAPLTASEAGEPSREDGPPG
jgi:NhaA family Na+:H+ antiporter